MTLTELWNGALKVAEALLQKGEYRWAKLTHENAKYYLGDGTLDYELGKDVDLYSLAGALMFLAGFWDGWRGLLREASEREEKNA